MRRGLRLFLVALVIALAPWEASHPRAQAPPPLPTLFYGIGDLVGGDVGSAVRDATLVNGIIYAVGSSTLTATAAPPAIPILDTPVLWTNTGGASGTLTALPNAGTTFTNYATAYAITPDAGFVANQARFFGTQSLDWARLDRVAGTNRDLTIMPGPIGMAALSLSDDGGIAYGTRLFNPGTGFVNVPLRYDIMNGLSNFPPLQSNTDSAYPIPRGTSSNGLVMVGVASSGQFAQMGFPPTGLGTNTRAFRYQHTLNSNPATGTTSLIGLLPDGHWNFPIAMTADGGVTVVAGDSDDFPAGEIYLTAANDTIIERLGSPNTGLMPRLLGGRTDDGVVAVTFSNSATIGPGNVSGLGIPVGNKYAYIRNSHGWFHFSSVLAERGVDLVAQGWDPTNLAITGVRTVGDVDLVFGQGRRRDPATTTVGAVEGFVAQLPAGALEEFDPKPTAPSDQSLVGTWIGGDVTNPGVVVSFLADGTYIRINNPAASGIPGFERGLYSWAGNAAGGAFALTTLFDTDGTNGSSARNGQMGLTQIVTGNALTFNDSYCTACGAFLPLTRLTWDAGSIVGGWILGNAALPNNTQYVVLLDSNAGFKFFVGGDNDGAGAEMGTYTWDPITHVFVTNPPDNGTTTVTLTRDELGVAVTTEQDGNVFTSSLRRIIAPSTVVPSFPDITLEADAAEDSAFSLPVAASNVLEFSATGLPAGVTIDKDTGVISGTPVVNGTFNVTITATNTFGDTALATLVLTVSPPPANFRGIGDLTGGGVASAVRDATRVNGVIYAVGASAVNNVNGIVLDTPALWTSAGSSSTLQALPYGAGITNTNTTDRTAYAITPGGEYIASQAQFLNSGTGTRWVRVDRSLVNAANPTTANLDISAVAGVPVAFAALAISANGGVLYGQGTNVDNTRTPRRYESGIGINIIDISSTGKSWGVPIPRGTSTNGAVMVGVASDGFFVQSPFPPIGLGTNTFAFRYDHTTVTTAPIDLLPDGHWNFPIALSSDGSVTVVAGDSETFPSGEIYLTDANNDVIERLGSPNSMLIPRLLGGRTDDGVVAVTFSNSATAGPGQIGGLGLPTGTNLTGTRYAYIRNSHGWYHFSSVLAAQGVDLVADGWDPTNIAITGVRTVEGVDLVFGQGRRRNPATAVLGALEGFVVELPAGVLADFNPTPTPPSDQSIVGTWLAGDPANPSVVFSYLADGTYVRINNAAAPGLPGFERGLYTWAGNAAGGAFVITTLYDTDGTAGGSFRNGQLGLTQIINGNTLTLTDTRCAACPAAPGTRLTWDAGSIVGGWIAGNAAQFNTSQYAVLLGSAAGFKYFVADDGVGGGNIELGTYTWDPITHLFVTMPPDNSTTTATLTRDELGLAVVINQQYGEVFTLNFKRTVAPSTVLPAFGAPLTANATVGEPFSYTIPGTYALTFESSELPDGLSLDSATGAITGTPTTTGTFTVDVTAINTFGGTAHAELELTNRRLQADLLIGAPLSGEYGASLGVTVGGGSGTGAFSFEGSNGCTASATTVTMTSGTVDCTITAHRAGDNEYWEKTATHVIDATTATSSTSVTSSPNPSSPGQVVNFVATVIGQHNGAVTGIVTFRRGQNTVLGTAAVQANGTATLPLSTLGNGSHVITAQYGGDSNSTGSTSPSVTQNVVAPAAATTTTLASSFNPAIVGKAVTLTAAVTSGTPGTITGTVTFRRGQILLSTQALSGGQATYTTTTLPQGSLSLTAVYNGDAQYITSTSPVLSQVVTMASTTTSLSSSESVQWESVGDVNGDDLVGRARCHHWNRHIQKRPDRAWHGECFWKSGIDDHNSLAGRFLEPDRGVRR